MGEQLLRDVAGDGGSTGGAQEGSLYGAKCRENKQTQNDCEKSVHGNVVNVKNGGFPLQCTILNIRSIVMVDFLSKCAETEVQLTTTGPRLIRGPR